MRIPDSRQTKSKRKMSARNLLKTRGRLPSNVTAYCEYFSAEGSQSSVISQLRQLNFTHTRAK
jgi:hypothetical protein